MGKEIDFTALMNSKKIYASDSDMLVTFVDEITDELLQIKDCVFCDGMTVLDNIGDYEDDIQSLYCIMKDGQEYCMQEFYTDFGAYEDREVFLNNIINLIADRSDNLNVCSCGEYGPDFVIGKKREALTIDVKYKGYDLQIVIEYVMENGKLKEYEVWTTAPKYGLKYFDFGTITKDGKVAEETLEELIDLIYGNFLAENICFKPIIKELKKHK